MMTLILCNEFKEFQQYMRQQFTPMELPQVQHDFTYATCSENINKIMSVDIKEIRIISQVTWFTFKDYFEMIRRIR